MLTAELKINGTTVVHIYAVNKVSQGLGLCEYEYMITDTAPYADRETEIKKGTVVHMRQEGLAELVRAIIEDSQDE